MSDRKFNMSVTSSANNTGLESARRATEDLKRSTEKTTLTSRDFAKGAQGVNTLLLATQRIASGDILGGLRMSFEALREKFGSIGVKLTAALGAFGAGWQLGTWIRDVTGLGNALDRLVAPTKVASASLRDLSMQRLTGLRDQLAGVKTTLEANTKAADDLIAKINLIAGARAAEARVAPPAPKPSGAPPAQEQSALAAATAKRQTAQEVAGVLGADATRARAVLNDIRAQLRDIQAEKQRLQAGVFNPFTNQTETAPTSAFVDLRTKEELLSKALAGAQDLETAAIDRATEARTAMLNAMADERDARDALTAAMKEQAAARQQADASRATGAAMDRTKAKTDRETARFEIETPERQLNYLRNKAREVLAEARGDQGPVSPARKDELRAEFLSLKKRAADIEAQRAQAAAQQAQVAADNKEAAAAKAKTIADKAAEAAEAARARVDDPAIARAQDRAAEERAKETKRKNDRFARTLADARRSGYSAVTDAGGGVVVKRDPHVLGVISKRYAEAIAAEARQRFADQKRAEANLLQQQAAAAQVKAVGLLEAIKTNTEKGPIS
jgi:hypothetical protein